MEKSILSVIGSLIGVIVALCVYIWLRTLGEQDKVNSDLYNKYNDLRSEFDELLGEHNVNACKIKKKKQVIRRHNP